MNNKKGQVLVLFVLLIPILLSCLTLVIDVGINYNTKRKVSNVTKDILEYGLNNIQNNNIEKEMQKLFKENLSSEHTVIINKSNNQIEINIDGKVASIFSYLIEDAKYAFDITYVGEINNGKIKIEKR